MPDDPGRGRQTAIAAVSWGEARIDRFWIGPEGDLLHAVFDGAGWLETESLGGDLDPSAGAAASSWSAVRIDVWAVGTDGRTWHRFWDGSRWVEWEQLEG